MKFVKLYGSLLDSTIWREPASTRLVWITLLAMADWDGRIMASVPGLADRARVTLEECVAALETLLAPDRWSRTQDHEGRRIRVVDGGWIVLNHAKYRDRGGSSAERVARYRQRKRERNEECYSVTLGSPDTDTDTDTDKDKDLDSNSGTQPPRTAVARPRSAKTDPRASQVIQALCQERERLGLRVTPSHRAAPQQHVIRLLEAGISLETLLAAVHARARLVEEGDDPSYFNAISLFTGPGTRGPGGWSVSLRALDRVDGRQRSQAPRGHAIPEVSAYPAGEPGATAQELLDVAGITPTADEYTTT